MRVNRVAEDVRFQPFRLEVMVESEREQYVLVQLAKAAPGITNFLRVNGVIGDAHTQTLIDMLGKLGAA
jgi:hypothetical protein